MPGNLGRTPRASVPLYKINAEYSPPCSRSTSSRSPVTSGTLNHQDKRSRQLQTRGWAAFAMCNKPANTSICHLPIQAIIYHTRSQCWSQSKPWWHSDRSLLKKSMAGKHEQAAHFPYSFAAFRHIPCSTSDLAICNKISWGVSDYGSV
jgi:hypothetical protein